MNLQKLEKQTHEAIDYWIKEYNRYDFDQITRKPSEHDWSLGQVGIHLWMSAKGFFFKNAERCLMQEGTEAGKSMKFSSHLIFTFKMLPPVKYEMPRQVAVVPKQPETKEQLIAKLEEVKTMASDFIKRIPQSNPDLKIKHPFLGWLNTAEWITLCNIHFRHHVRQKQRIEKHFGWK
ncbi:MAG TPA: DinB family protein [Chitinophagales bacterium]|nr:DinB family protein [Chitinophagales bacterium]